MIRCMEPGCSDPAASDGRCRLHMRVMGHRRQRVRVSRVRGVAVELAWLWRRYQPRSELTRWFEHRFGAGGKRARKVGIVALARRLMVALWRYLQTGIVPAGATVR